MQACVRAGRDRTSVRLLPITTTVPARILRHAFEAAMRTFGENKVQEAMTKRAALEDLAIEWSIVGHLPTNKVKYLARFAREFHALVRRASSMYRSTRPTRRASSVSIRVRFSPSSMCLSSSRD
jgi:uncharacterized pyridoxal phosphate-containing UPF0001 family protein